MLGKESPHLEGKTRKNNNSVAPDLTFEEHHYDVIIWMGDMNYRINGNVGSITKAIEQDMFEVLINND